MGKLLSLAIIIALIYFFIVPKFRTKDEKKSDKNDEKTQNLVLCECCGAFVSEDEIHTKNKQQICNECEKKEK
ncbi:MAG: hypothetical protein J6W17_00170 [Campylobacter sp.]|nr:hypothetical protein [Campylobacter sp.]